jgi:hypothetical protein
MCAMPFVKTSFAGGELAPSVWGRTDLSRYHIGTSTMRNFFVNYRGGAATRAGTAFVGQCKQPASAAPPRDIKFQFNINQGYALEFGDNYMRVKSQGAYVVEPSIPITGATQANPCFINATTTAITAATPVNTGVLVPYAPGDTITLAGGTFSTPAVLTVTNTLLTAVASATPGSGYVPADTITLTGGTQTTPALLTVATTQVASATINAGGSGGTDGTQTVTGTTGTGTKFQASVTVAGGVVTAVLGITISGSYTANPTDITQEPVTGASLTGAKLALTVGVRNVTVTTPGVFTVNPTGNTFAQNSTSGGGTGATFQSAVFAPHAVSVTNGGTYGTLPSNPVSQASTSGRGVGAEFTVTGGGTAQAYNNGDWVFISGIVGMTQLNGRTFIVSGSGVTGFSLTDLFGNSIDSTGYSAYVSGGTVARIYTLATPWAAVDLPYLKYTQSADVMSLCCVNQATSTEYPPYDLSRITASDWTLAQTTFASSISAPTGCTGATQAGGTWVYQYVVTAVDSVTGDESIASNIATIQSAVNAAISANTLTVSWSPVAGASHYQVYRADPSLTLVPVGALFGFVGTALGTQFTDSNITADFTTVPPVHLNPFARGAINGINVTAGGSGYTQATVAYAVTTSTGTGFVGTPIIINGALTAFLIQNGGENYTQGDTINFTDSGSGTGASATLTLGALSGTYPGGVAYFQQRRYYFNTLNAPDTYFGSQPGAFTNFDASVPVVASDAITGTPWSQQINGIQAMVPEQSGLVILTGSGAWQLTGGANQTAVTPANQDATPQAYNGISATIMPIPINYDILYVQCKGSIVRDLSYNFFVNIYTGADKTELSSHLFTNYQIQQWAYAEEPYKVVWAVRNDGILLSLTFLKDEDVSGWARHDTNGIFECVVSITEPPVDAVYFIVKRYVLGINNGQGAWAYYSERLDNRLWTNAASSWCVDCGLSYPANYPNATLQPGSAAGTQNITGTTLVVGGVNYITPVCNAVDPAGKGTGATFSVTESGGVITAVTVLTSGQGYSKNTHLVISDAGSAGSGCVVYPVITNITSFTASSAVFANVAGQGAVGDVINLGAIQPGSTTVNHPGGGMATVTQFVSSTEVMANITTAITSVVPDDPNNLPLPQGAGSWSIINPISTVSGLNHLEGMEVSILADGGVVEQQTVTNGAVTLPAPTSQIVVGLPFTAQLQTLYLDVAGVNPTVQGRRIQIPSLTVRTVASRGIFVGGNQPDASAQQNGASVPWTEMVAIPEMANSVTPGQPIPLITGDNYCHPAIGWHTGGQVAIQVTDPVPCEIIALIPEIEVGDTPR